MILRCVSVDSLNSNIPFLNSGSFIIIYSKILVSFCGCYSVDKSQFQSKNVEKKIYVQIIVLNYYLKISKKFKKSLFSSVIQFQMIYSFQKKKIDQLIVSIPMKWQVCGVPVGITHCLLAFSNFVIVVDYSKFVNCVMEFRVYFVCI